MRPPNAGLGSVVLGGLLFSTLFTLILVPVGFSLALDARRALGRKLALSGIGAGTGARPAAIPGETVSEAATVRESQPAT